MSCRTTRRSRGRGRHEAGVNTATGAVEVWDAGTVETLRPCLEAAAEATQRRLFDTGSRGREQVWRAVEAFTEELRREGRWTYLQVCDEAARLLAARGEPTYRHVVVDEAQDLHPAQWRMLRAAVGPGPDDLLIAGDTRQRIYDNRVSLRRLGISVAGRSSRLRINYRTTAEILRWGLGILTGEAPDDMDEGEETLSG